MFVRARGQSPSCTQAMHASMTQTAKRERERERDTHTHTDREGKVSFFYCPHMYSCDRTCVFSVPPTRTERETMESLCRQQRMLDDLWASTRCDGAYVARRNTLLGGRDPMVAALPLSYTHMCVHRCISFHICTHSHTGTLLILCTCASCVP